MFTGFHTMGAGDWVLMTLFWVALVALVAFAIVRLFPAAAPTNGPAQSSAEDPRRILDRRLAAGEIDVDAYERLKAELDPQSPSEER
jgi:putative membrane protein